MKTVYLILTIFLITNTIFSQDSHLPVRPYEPIQFSNIQPIWYYTIKDTTPSNVKGNGYNLLFHNWRCLPVLRDNHLYTSYLTTYNGDAAGSYLEKRNIKTRELIWKHSYGQ